MFYGTSKSDEKFIYACILKLFMEYGRELENIKLWLRNINWRLCKRR